MDCPKCGEPVPCWCGFDERRYDRETEERVCRPLELRALGKQPHCPGCAKPGVFWNIATNRCWECEQKMIGGVSNANL